MMTTTDTAPGTWMLAFSEGPGSHLMSAAPDGDWLSLAAPIHADVMASDAREAWSVQDIAEMLRQGHPIPISKIDPPSLHDDDDERDMWERDAISVRSGLTLYASDEVAEDAGATIVWGEDDTSLGEISHETLPDGLSWVAAYAPDAVRAPGTGA